MKKTNICLLIFFVFVMLFLVFVCVLNYQISTIYKYNVQKDYIYNFSGSSVKNVACTVEKEYFIIPHIDDSYDTGFIPIRVISKKYWSIAEPYIEIYWNNIVYRQYFERGARGIRYLNIGYFLQGGKEGEKKIRLRGANISWETQKVDAVFFKNLALDKERILVLAPHPDDAEIAAFGLYNNKNSYIITITAGEYGYFSGQRNDKDEFLQTMNRGWLRVIDSITTPLIGGISPSRTYNFGYFDKSLKAMYENKNIAVENKVLRTSNNGIFRKYNVSNMMDNKGKVAKWSSVVSDMVEVLKIVRPSIIVTPNIYSDRHDDHKLTTVALIDALRKNNQKGYKLYLYSNHDVHSGYFPYGPSGSGIGLPPCFDNSIVFSSVYSYNLTYLEQMKKIFSLDAQHDIRPFVSGPNEDILFVLRNISGKLFEYVNNNIFIGDTSYYRRSIRLNEIFLVIEPEDLDRYIEKFHEYKIVQ